MKRLVLGLAIVLVAVFVLVGATVGPAESAGATLRLKASKTTCSAGTSIKFTATRTSGRAPYAVRLYKRVSGSWRRVATLSQVSATQYSGYATASPAGKRPFKAACVNSAGTVLAYSNIVTVKVK